MPHEVLRLVFGDRPVTVAPLPGGLTNQNFRVDAGGETFVLRLAGEDTELLGIDRDREEACSRLAAVADIGPEVIAFLPEHNALVTRFLPGKVLTEADATKPDVLRRIADALRRCHAVAVADRLGRFSVFDTVRSYVGLAGERNVPLPDSLPGALERLRQIEEGTHSADPPCLCHNDLLAGNFIDDGKTIRLIDWEYAGRGDRFFDLGNLAANLQLGPGEEENLLEAYFGEARPNDLRRLRLMRLASDMREAAWGFLQAAISKLHPPGYYLAYGQKHLDRFLAGSTP
ncbi:MAG: choline/ethanolamine kinase family protein [Gemmataceae bacterium]